MQGDFDSDMLVLSRGAGHFDVDPPDLSGEHIVRVQVAQQDADRPSLWGSLLAGMPFSVFKNARLQPSSNQADDPQISDSVLHKAE